MIKNIHELHKSYCCGAGNINEHLPVLRMFSAMSEGVAELGIDRGTSTVALLAGQDDRLTRNEKAWYYGIDINPACQDEVSRLMPMCNNQFVTRFLLGSSLKIALPGVVDFLLIDSIHTAVHIQTELKLHLSNVRKYVALHDTETFGVNGETPNTKGILYGIQELLTAEWRIVYDSPRCHGLVVFERISV